jgi:hypothetical protein
VKLNRRFYLARKALRRLINPHKGDGHQVLFILGAQRSGTTLMTRILEVDWEARVYPEHSKLSSADTLDGLRLNPYDEVREVIARDRYPLIVLKPLVESQNTDRLLRAFPGSRAVWMLRHYKDVAVSNLDRFGISNGIKNLRFIITGQDQNWRAEGLPAEVVDLVKSHFSEGMDPYDAAALFWYVRNTFFFNLALGAEPAVKICRYDDLVERPGVVMAEIYDFVGRPYPGDHIVKGVFKSSLKRGEHIRLSPGIESHCQELWDRFGT